MGQIIDRRSILGLCVGTAAGAAFLASAAPSYAAPVTFKADLKGATEVPPNTTGGTGTITASYDASTQMLTWSGSYSGSTGPGDGGAFPRSGRPRQERRRGDLDFDQRRDVRRARSRARRR